MPISRKQFERGADPIVEEIISKIHRFLNEHTDGAYTDSELVAVSMVDSGGKEVNDAFNEALNKLIELEMAEKKVIGGTDYYAYKEKKKLTKRYGF